MTLHDQMTELAVTAILQDEGVTCKYTPSSGEERTITAGVKHGLPSGLAPLPHGASDEWTVTVKNSATTGISASELNTAKDVLKVPSRHGQSLIERKINKILIQTEGYMVLGIR